MGACPSGRDALQPRGPGGLAGTGRRDLRRNAAFTRQKSSLFLLDLTLTYRRNHDRFSSVWTLQVKNALGAQETILDYNFATERVEEVKEGFPLAVLSYKIDF